MTEKNLCQDFHQKSGSVDCFTILLKLNIIFLSNSSSLDLRIVFGNTQYRSKVTVTVTLSPSRKYRSKMPTSAITHHCWMTMQWVFVQHSIAVLGPIVEYYLFNLPLERRWTLSLKSTTAAAQGTCFFNSHTQYSAIFLISFAEFLHRHHFVWTLLHIVVKDYSQTSNGKVKSGGMLLCR